MTTQLDTPFMQMINEIVEPYTRGSTSESTRWRERRHWSGSITYTPGIEDLMESEDCYWLLDEIAMANLHYEVRRQPFQVWRLKHNWRNFRGNALTCEDGSGQLIFSKLMDNDLIEQSMWCVKGLLMLPEEYNHDDALNRN